MCKFPVSKGNIGYCGVTKPLCLNRITGEISSALLRISHKEATFRRCSGWHPSAIRFNAFRSEISDILILEIWV